MTDAEFKSWLAKGGRHTTLIEVGLATPLYLSTVSYTTLPTDTPANQYYSSIVAGGMALNESLSLSGGISLSVGDIEIHNDDGSLDNWLNLVWVNRPIKVFVGDLAWGRADFRLVFDGIVANLQPSSATRWSINLRDKLQKLNTPVSEALLGGTTPNKDRLLPIVLGECHNVEPLLIDPANHEYLCHNGAVERIIEVRADGVPRTTVAGSRAGAFRLTAAPYGTVTASVQGRVPYTNTVAGLVKILATSYGNPSDRFSVGELDTANLNAFDAAHPQPVGLWLQNRENVLQVCQNLADSVGAQVAVGREGKLKLVKISLPAGASTLDILQSDYEAMSLTVVERSVVVAGVRLQYCRNWTVQSSLDTGIPSQHKDLFAQEWLTATSRDGAVATTYNLFADPPETESLLLKNTDAQAEAARRLALWSVPRNVYQVQGYAQLLLLELGQTVKLYGNRYDCNAGKVGIVVGLESDWVSRRVTVRILA